MRRIFFLAFALCSVGMAMAQSKPAKVKNLKWKNGGVFSVMGAQTGSRNWAVAPEKFSLTGIASLNLWANKTWGRNTWDNSADLAYGLSNTQSSGIRKVDDKLDIYTRYSYNLSKTSNLVGFGLIGNLRSQFSNGYDYSETPRRRISGFFAPAYLLFSPGLHFRPLKNLTLAFGPAARWIIVSNNPYSYNYQGGVKPDGNAEKSVASMYGVDPVKTSRFEAGAFLSATYKADVLKNVNYRTRFDIMSNTLETTGNLDIYWTNNFTMSVNKWLKVTYNYDLVYDDDVKIFGKNKSSAATQMRSVLGVGLAVGF
ncbi:MAG: hypothetical protein JWP88_2303 [Flaviaesturariibacter sp.]|nr:hypothetical protein [Flaviaesturariibacter sp.]